MRIDEWTGVREVKTKLIFGRGSTKVGYGFLRWWYGSEVGDGPVVWDRNQRVTLNLEVDGSYKEIYREIGRIGDVKSD